jgi:Ca2+/Na+ antiporter
MCTIRRFLADYCLEWIDSYSPDIHGVSRIRPSGVFLELVVLVASYRIMTTLSREFITPAIESFTLRCGARGSVTSKLITALVSSAPEISLSIMVAMKSGKQADLSVVISTILGGWWISFLLFPAAVVLSRKWLDLNPFLMLRDISFALLICAILLRSSRNQSFGITESFLLLALLAVYCGVLSSTEHFEVEARRRCRESSLRTKLVPLQAALRGHSYIEAISYRLALTKAPSDRENTPLVPMSFSNDMNSLRVHGEIHFLSDSNETSRCEEPNKLNGTNRTLIRYISRFCVLSIPGTETERLFFVSLLNSFLLLSLFSSLTFSVLDRLVTLVIPGKGGGLIGPLLLGGLSKIFDFILLVDENATHRDRHIVQGNVSNIISLTFGVGFPCLIGCIIQGDYKLDIVPFSACLTATFMAVGLLSALCLCGIDGSSLIFKRCSPFVISYFVVVVVFCFLVLGDSILIHS